MKTQNEIESFARLVEQDQRTRYIAEYGNNHPDLISGACCTHVHMGKKFARVDIGSSGRYMVDLETGEIFGIKAYGVVHKGWRFGTLDTIQDWNWGDYRAVTKPQTPRPAVENKPAWTVSADGFEAGAWRMRVTCPEQFKDAVTRCRFMEARLNAEN